MELQTLVESSYKVPPFTDFSLVSPQTRLEELNLNWHERDLPEWQRTKHVHRLHPYLGKFIPQLVEIFLRKYQPKLVYDPFCGSGTTLVEANALDIESVGCDISFFNFMLSKVKTQVYDLDLLRKEIYGILAKVSDDREGSLFGLSGGGAKELKTDNLYLNEWFAPRAVQELLCYKSLIPHYRYQDLLKIILSRSARSARLTTHYDLDFPKRPQRGPYECYKHSRTCHPVQEAYKFLRGYSIDTFERVKEFDAVRSKARVTVLHGDARTITLPKGIDCIITSPPYVGLIDYHEQHRYAYELLDLPNNEYAEIGRAAKGRSEEAQREYINGVNEVFLNAKKNMAPHAVMVVVVHDSNNLYDPQAIGFKEEARIDRHVNRRTGRRQTAFYESVLVWRKR